jgi:hypothetical protein
LISAPGELSEIAGILSTSGISVTVVASVGLQNGGEVFENRGVSLPAEVTLLEISPTREWLRENLSRFSHIYYTGHGVGGEGT